MRSVREADARRADNAAFLHPRLEIVRSRPCMGFRHIRDILEDHDVVRIVRIAEHSSIGNARGMAGLFAAVVARAPRAIIPDLVMNSKVLSFVLRIHSDFSEIEKIQIRMIIIQIMDGMWESESRYQDANDNQENCIQSVILTSKLMWACSQSVDVIRGARFRPYKFDHNMLRGPELVLRAAVASPRRVARRDSIVAYRIQPIAGVFAVNQHHYALQEQAIDLRGAERARPNGRSSEIAD
jgi:hypothetical protein